MRRLPITLIELTTEVLPKLKYEDVTCYNGWVVSVGSHNRYRIEDMFSGERWLFDARRVDYYEIKSH